MSTVVIAKPSPVDLGIENGSYPDNLLSCPDQYLETDKNGQYFTDCNSVSRGDYCSFSKSLDTGVITATLFNNSCLLCQIRHQKGSQFVNYENNTFQHLGFVKGVCPAL